MNKILTELENKVKKLAHADREHDIYHLKRVLNLALAIQKKEGGDKLIIAISSFLHDIHRIIQKETGTFCSPKNSLPMIKKIIDKIKLTEKEKEKILHCIEFHEEYNFSENGKTVKNIETLILQDADNLDALGAIGIARAFSFSGAHNIAMWHPETPFDREKFDESEEDPSEIHHFYSKLLKLKDNMNTKTGKKLAKSRHDFIVKYLDEFLQEWDGKK